jgi:hypothetical protein
MMIEKKETFAIAFKSIHSFFSLSPYSQYVNVYYHEKGEKEGTQLAE